MTTDLRSLEFKITKCIGDLSPAETQAHPPERWSVQQTVEHLVLTYAATTEVLAGRIAKGRPTQARRTFVQHLSQFYVVRLGCFPGGIRAPEAVMPPPTTVPQSGAELAGRSSAELQRLNATLERASELFGAQTRSVSHLILGPLSPEDWRRFHTVHGLHHLGHIESIKRIGLRKPNRAADLLRR